MKLCSAKFEELDPLNVATALNGFFERYVMCIILFADSTPSSFRPLEFQNKMLPRGDYVYVSLYRENFNFHLDLKVTPDPQQLQPVVPVFWFLEKALDRLMREREIEEYRIYPTMLWSKYFGMVFSGIIN